MATNVDGWNDLGDGRVQVFTRTETGGRTSVIIGRNLMGSADMFDMLRRAAAQHDQAATALAARAGRTDQD
jgi:NADPH-dependent 2,4-dienoyl-CoA reductase/sulfur reductase-like enzyme